MVGDEVSEEAEARSHWASPKARPGNYAGGEPRSAVSVSQTAPAERELLADSAVGYRAGR